ncbi:hypothetical protein MHYP_G00124830 [Metynnis hypsauchen]
MDLHCFVVHHPRMVLVCLVVPYFYVVPEHHHLHSRAFTWGTQQHHAQCDACYPDHLKQSLVSDWSKDLSLRWLSALQMLSYNLNEVPARLIIV